VILALINIILMGGEGGRKERGIGETTWGTEGERDGSVCARVWGGVIRWLNKFILLDISDKLVSYRF